MTVDAFSTFSVCLEYLPHGTAPAWDAGCSRFYFAVLSDVPDAAVVTLMKAVGSQFKFRPTPHEILEVWRKVSAPALPFTPVDLVAKLSERVRKHGAHGRPHPTLRNCYIAGPPPDLTSEELSIVTTWGGWGPFCEDESPTGVRRGQLLKAAEMVLAGHRIDGLRQLRLEYLAANPPALTAPLPALTAEYTDAPSPVGSRYEAGYQHEPESQREAAQVMAHIHSRTSGLRMVRTGGDTAEEAA